MRRVFAVLGVVLLVGGIATAVALLVLGPRYRDRQIDDLARAAVGCTTPLAFTQTGTFYVYQELDSPAAAGSSTCPATAAGGTFGFELRDPAGGAVPVTEDHSVGYDDGDHAGTSLARFEVPAPGTYAIAVQGPSTATAAAVGPDPGSVSSSYRTWALINGIAGLLLGVGFLVASGAIGRSREPEAAPAAMPVGESPWAPPTGPPRPSA